MDAVMHQMFMMELNSQANQAMGQPSMYSYYPYSTDTSTSPAPVQQPFTYYSNHHDASTASPHGHTVHPVHQQYQHRPHNLTFHPVHQQYQQYESYSPQHIPQHDQGVRGFHYHEHDHYHDLHPPQPHQTWNHHPAAQFWERAVRVADPNAAHRSRGNNGGHGKPRHSHAHPPPSRDSRHRSGGKPPAAKAHGGAKHRSHGKSRREVDDGTWSTATQG